MDYLPTYYALNNTPSNVKFPYDKVNTKSKLEEYKDIEDELSSLSMPRNLTYSMARKSRQARTRDAIYLEREEIFNDKSVREMVKLIIKRSQCMPFYFRLDKNAKLSTPIRAEIESNFSYLEELINRNLFEMIIESQFLGDSYCAIEPIEGKGITRLIHNFSTKAFNVTPIITNKEREVAFEIADGRNQYTVKNIRTTSNRENNRVIVKPQFVGRLNAKSSGVRIPTVNAILNADNMNAWETERAYEDLVYGGVIEGTLESYRMFKWALRALSNARVGSSYLERFIMLHLQDTSKSERKILREALKTNLDIIRKKVDAKQESNDPSVSVFNYVIPTTGASAKGSIDIQESSPSLEALKSIEDINIHIKKFMADLGFNINLTPYGETQEGGAEDGGWTAKSLIMEAQGEQIRESVKEYCMKICSIHFAYKYQIAVKDISVEFIGVADMVTAQDEINRMEALNNAQNFWGFVSDLKDQNFKDTPQIRKMLSDQIEPKMEKNTRDKIASLKAIVDHVLTPAVEPENSEG